MLGLFDATRGCGDTRVRDLGAVAASVSLGYLGVLTLASLVPQMAWSRGAMLVSYLLAVCFVGLSRFYLRIKVELARTFRRPGARGADASGKATQVAKVLIAGAGSAGVMVAKELAAHPEMGRVAVGYVDDDPAKAGGMVLGLPVLGFGRDIPRIVEERQVDEVIIAMPSAGGQAIRDVVATCRQLGVKIQTLPGVQGDYGRKVSLKQLPGYSDRGPLRAAACIWIWRGSGVLHGRKVLITGAGAP